MEEKQCTRCKEVKSTLNFCKNKNRRDGYQSACKSCMNSSYTMSRKKKPDHYNQVKRKRVLSNVQKLRDWKESKGCSRCNEKDPSCLELHHLDPSIKETHVATVVGYWSEQRLQQEIAKCIILCSNCHKKFHAGRFELDLLNN